MAEPPKESVRNALPQKPETTPVIPPRRSPQAGASPILRPLPKPTGPPLSLLEPAASLLAATASENFADGPGPRKETARLPGLSAAAILPSGPILAATSNGLDAFDSIPRWFCWSLLGLSALIFLIQSWNYALS